MTAMRQGWTERGEVFCTREICGLVLVVERAGKHYLWSVVTPGMSGALHGEGSEASEALAQVAAENAARRALTAGIGALDASG